MVQAEGLDLGFPAVMARLHVLARSFDESPEAFVKFSRGALEQGMRSNRRDQIESICQVIARTLEQTGLRQYRGMEPGRVFRDIFDPRFSVELARRDARSARVLFSLGKRLHDSEWVFEFSRRFLDVFSHEGLPFGAEGLGSDSVDFAEWLLLFREMGGAAMSFRYADRRDIHPKFLDRMLDPRHLLELSERSPEGALD